MLGMTTKKFNEISANLSVDDLVEASKLYRRPCVFGAESKFSAVFGWYYSQESIDEMRNDLEDLGVACIPSGGGLGIQVMCYDGIFHVSSTWTVPQVKRYTERKAERLHAKYIAHLA